MVKRALLMGCNYPGSDAELRGCVNDVFNMQKLLTESKGFDESNITVMVDTDKKYEQPTGRNMKKALQKIIDEAESGDVIYIHYSGHGTQIPAEGGDAEADGKDEAMVPTDMNLIVDDDFREIVGKLKDGVDLTIVCDCCHSGSLLDHSEVHITGDKRLDSMKAKAEGHGDRELGADGEPTQENGASEGGEEEGTREAPSDVKNRSLPVDKLAKMLAKKLGFGEALPMNMIRTGLFQLFGDDSSSMVKSTLQKALGDNYGGVVGQLFSGGVDAVAGGGKKSGGGGGGGSSGLMKLVGGACCGKESAASAIPSGGPGGMADWAGLFANGAPPAGNKRKPDKAHQLSEDKGLLITGCMEAETSADASSRTGEAFGALTNAIIETHKKHPNATSRELVMEVREHLKKSGFKQNPQLEGSGENADKIFICEE